jgi:hypothetical protein
MVVMVQLTQYAPAAAILLSCENRTRSSPLTVWLFKSVLVSTSIRALITSRANV